MKRKRHISLSTLVKVANTPTPWDLGNEVLYKLCAKYPHHNCDEEIIAKILLIGRVYSAAIERRRKIGKYKGDDFYTEAVAPKIRKAGIDRWLKPFKKMRSGINEQSLDAALDAHYRLTNLFSDISGLNKRSLASKYLHFHFPDHFFIYDSRAVKGIQRLAAPGRPASTSSCADRDYEKFVRQCLGLRDIILEHDSRAAISPRKLDKILLHLAQN